MTQSPSQDERFQRMFTSHRDAVWSYCYRRLPRNDVADAVSETFLVAWRRIGDAPAEPATLPWLYAVARNVVRNARRSGMRRHRLNEKVVTLGAEPSPDVEVQVVKRAADEELLAAVARLSDSDQELLRLRTWEELSHADIAAVVGKSIRSVESRLARVRKKLASSLAVPAGEASISRPRPVEEGGER